jgi:hypothetical protein
MVNVNKKLSLFCRLKIGHDFDIFFLRAKFSRQKAGLSMFSQFAARSSDRFGTIARVALLLLIAATTAITQAQSPLIHIKVFNAKSGHPITDERLNVALRADQIGSVAMGTDKNGIIEVDPGKATIIRILSNMYGDCRPRGELYTNYSIDTILKTGITTGNLCSSSQHKAKPGELVLYEIPKTYIPSFPAPPLPPPPHTN